MISKTIYPLGSAHLSSWNNAFYHRGKKHYPRGGVNSSSGEISFYPQGKENGYPLVISGTLSSAGT